MFLLSVGIVTKTNPTQTLPGREGLKSILFRGRFSGGGSFALYRLISFRKDL
jgi:hypothetical protein